MKDTGYTDSNGNHIHIGDRITVIPRSAVHSCVVQEIEHPTIGSKLYLIEKNKIFAALEYVKNPKVKSKIIEE